jgi:serine/threonine protein phosphatase PrpC
MKKNIIAVLLACVASLSMAKIDMSYGIKTEQNRRDYQEDRFVHAHLDGGEWFGVYDGHGGDKTSSYLQQQLHEYFYDSICYYITHEIGYSCPVEQVAFESAFFKADKYARNNFDDGSTAVVAYVDTNDILHCAWAGDSRAVLESDGTVGFATQDHKPDRADEKKRIEDAGGNVFIHGVWRANGLAISRSIGDKSCKVGADGQIIATPDYAQIQLNEDNHFMIIASDGLWDVMDNGSAINLVKEQLQLTDDLGAIAQSLIDEAKKRTSGDNITVSVVTFDHSKKDKTSH